MELTFTLQLPEPLYLELLASCQERRCSPKQFTEETLAAALAVKRLPKVTQGPIGVRVIVEAEAELDEHRTGKDAV